MIWDSLVLDIQTPRGHRALAAWRVAPSLIVERLRDVVDRREAVRLRVSPMSSGWMERRGYWLPASASFRLKLRVWSVKRRVRKAARRG